MADANTAVPAIPRSPHHDDSAAAGRGHGRDHAARRQEQTERIDAPSLLEIGGRHRLHVAPYALARVVDENLDRPEFRLDGGENGLYGGGLGHVAGECAAIRQLGGEGLDPILAPGEQRYGVVLGGEAASECLAIAGSETGNVLD